jgi:hypothetical protein
VINSIFQWPTAEHGDTHQLLIDNHYRLDMHRRPITEAPYAAYRRNRGDLADIVVTDGSWSYGYIVTEPQVDDTDLWTPVGDVLWGMPGEFSFVAEQILVIAAEPHDGMPKISFDPDENIAIIYCPSEQITLSYTQLQDFIHQCLHVKAHFNLLLPTEEDPR